MRKLYVWRVVAEVPPAYLTLGWEPQNWDRDFYSEGFRWPRRRNFLSEKSAMEQAQRFRDYGAFATVVRSEPIQFPVGLEDTDPTPEHIEYSRDRLVRLTK
jgi:hypothetical protein